MYYVAAFPGDTGNWEYVQVSLPGKSFPDQLAKPSAADLPFRRPEVLDPNSKKSSPMSPAEVVRIVDFVRQPSNYQDPAIKNMLRWSTQKPYDWPILGIRREGSVISASSGFSHNLMWARWWSIKLECTASGYKITSVRGPYVA